MAIITAGNFYWAGFKPAGRHAVENPDYVYERGTTLFGSALGIDGGVGGCTGYSWNEAGNWFIQKSGFTNDPANPGGFVEGFYYEDAPRTPRTDDNVYFTSLTPDDPGIDGFFPASECLFGGITGGDGAGGGTWDSGDGFASGVCGGNLNKIFLEQDYTSFMGASFQFGNVFGSTFGQQFLGNSANIKIGGFTSMLGRGTTASLVFTNTDGTTVEFLGNTFMFFDGGTGPIGINGLMAGLQDTEEGAGLSAGFTLAANQHFIATTGISGSTFATEALYRGLLRGISSGNLKMTIDGSVIPGATLIGITQNIPGVGGNIFLTGNLIGYTAGGTASFQSTTDINLLGNTLVGGTGEFVGGSKNNTEQPKLSVKADTFTVRGDSNINLNDSRIDQQLFVLSGAQYNYKNGRISQAIFARDRIDYLGPSKTSASLLDTEVGNSVVISGGGFQSQTETELTKLNYPEAIDPANIGAGYTAAGANYGALSRLYARSNNAGLTPIQLHYMDYLQGQGGLNPGILIEMGGLAYCSTDPQESGCTLNDGVGKSVGDIFYGRQGNQYGGLDRVLSFTEIQRYYSSGPGGGSPTGSTADLNETDFLDRNLNWTFMDNPGFINSGRVYVRLVGQQTQREVRLIVRLQSANSSEIRDRGDVWGCGSTASCGGTGEIVASRKWVDISTGGPGQSAEVVDPDDPIAVAPSGDVSVYGDSARTYSCFDYVYESDPYGSITGVTLGGTSPFGKIQYGEPEPYFQYGEKVDIELIPIPAEVSFTNEDVSGTRPVTYVRPTNTIPNVVIDAMRHGNVIIEGAATTLDMKPEHEHQNGQAAQGKVFINKPLDFTERLDYTTINLKAYNDAENIAGTKDNNLLFLNAGLTIGDLDIGAGTVAVGTNIGDREITVVKGEMSDRAVLKARSETNPSYQGFKIGDDFTAITANAQGILISHPAANIEFSTGHFVLASFADGNTGAETGFQRPGGAVPAPGPGIGKGS